MGAIKLKHTSGNGTILNSPAANPSSDITLKLPSTTGSAGQVLKVASANHSSTNAELEFAAAVGGKILQVVQTVKTDTTSRGGSSGNDALAAIPGLSVDITPSATSSKIYVVVNIKQGSLSSAWIKYQLQRDSTGIYLGDTVSGKIPVTNFSYPGNDYGFSSVSENFLDSPNTTSQITYQVYWGVRTDSGRIGYINRTGYDASVYAPRGASSITAMEVAA